MTRVLYATYSSDDYVSLLGSCIHQL